MVCYRKQGAVTGDNCENPKETIFLITGEAEVTVEEKTWIAKAPEKIEFPKKTYHKIEALSDLSFVLFEG